MVAELDLKTGKFTKGVSTAVGSMGKLTGSVAKSRAVAVGLGVGLERLAETGVRAFGDTIQTGLRNLADLETATTSVDAAIKQVGLTGQVTSGQIATWAGQIETAVGSAFDDKAITASAATLLRYGKVTEDNLQPALVVMTDLAAKTGDVESAASLLAKALADPTKAAGKLARSGVILTKAQQDQIKAFVKAGKTGKAQKVILDSLAATTKGAALASQGPYARSLNQLKDIWEDVTKSLAVGFLPIIEKVRGILSTELAKPSTLNNIKEFGKTLASGLGNLIDVARSLPWDAIGNALRIAGTGAKAVLDAFLAMPPWVQTAIVTGWGLNKLSGGALSGLIGNLASGLVKGVLGINAGVVNLKAATVVGGGAPAGAAGGVAKAGLSTLGKVFLVGEAVGLVAAVIGVQQGIAEDSTQHAAAIQTQTQTWLAQQPKREDLVNGLAAIDKGIADIKSNPLNVLVSGDALQKLEAMRTDTKAAIQDADEKQRQKLNVGFNEQRTAVAAAAAKGTTDSQTNATRVTSHVDSGTSQIVGAIHGIPAPVVKVSSTNITKNSTVIQRAGPTGGSRNVGRNGSFREFG
jgi:hypothetical protein